MDVGRSARTRGALHTDLRRPMSLIAASRPAASRPAPSRRPPQGAARVVLRAGASARTAARGSSHGELRMHPGRHRTDPSAADLRPARGRFLRPPGPVRRRRRLLPLSLRPSIRAPGGGSQGWRLLPLTPSPPSQHTFGAAPPRQMTPQEEQAATMSKMLLAFGCFVLFFLLFS